MKPEDRKMLADIINNLKHSPNTSDLGLDFKLQALQGAIAVKNRTEFVLWREKMDHMSGGNDAKQGFLNSLDKCLNLWLNLDLELWGGLKSAVGIIPDEKNEVDQALIALSNHLIHAQLKTADTKTEADSKRRVDDARDQEIQRLRAENMEKERLLQEAKDRAEAAATNAQNANSALYLARQENRDLQQRLQETTNKLDDTTHRLDDTTHQLQDTMQRLNDTIHKADDLAAKIKAHGTTNVRKKH